MSANLGLFFCDYENLQYIINIPKKNLHDKLYIHLERFLFTAYRFLKSLINKIVVNNFYKLLLIYAN